MKYYVTSNMNKIEAPYCGNPLNPKFEDAERVHDWRNYVSENLRAIWGTFTDDQKYIIAESFDRIADREEWD